MIPLHLPNDPAVLKAMIAALQAENQKMSASLRAHDLLVQALRVRIAKLQKQKFGPSSERIEREIEQLELALEDLQVALAEADDTPPDEDETRRRKTGHSSRRAEKTAPPSEGVEGHAARASRA